MGTEMPEQEFFPQRPELHPTIYAYEDLNPEYAGLLKSRLHRSGRDAAGGAAIYPTKRPDGKLPYRIMLRQSAMYEDGTSFTDHDVHRLLKTKRLIHEGGEWFRCTVDDVQAAIIAVRKHEFNNENRTLDFVMRPEQVEAVAKTAEYFTDAMPKSPDQAPTFPLERQDAVRQDLCRLSVGEEDGLAQGAGADLQAGGAEAPGKRT